MAPPSTLSTLYQSQSLPKKDTLWTAPSPLGLTQRPELLRGGRKGAQASWARTQAREMIRDRKPHSWSLGRHCSTWGSAPAALSALPSCGPRCLPGSCWLPAPSLSFPTISPRQHLSAAVPLSASPELTRLSFTAPCGSGALPPYCDRDPGLLSLLPAWVSTDQLLSSYELT